MLTADDVLTRTFPPTKFRQGYEVVEVDDFLDRVVGAFRYYESGGIEGEPIDPNEITTTTFSVTKFREGYDLSEVDSFLDEVQQCLVQLARTGVRSAAQPAQPAQRFAAPHHEEPRYSEPQPQYTEPQYSDPQYSESQYVEPRYAQQQHTEPPHPTPQYSAPQHNEPQRRAAGHQTVSAHQTAPRGPVDLSELVNALQRSYLLTNIPSNSVPVVITPDGGEYVVRMVTHDSGQVVIELG